MYLSAHRLVRRAALPVASTLLVLTFPLMFSSRAIGLSQAAPTFTRVTSGPIWDDVNCSHGLHWVDYNNDGYLDLYITGWFVDHDHANALYTNDGNGGFTKVTTGAIVTDVQSVSGSWADYDNDGDIDGFVGHSNLNPIPQNNYMYVNNGDGSFTKLAAGSVVTDLGHTGSAVWGDFDNDGDADLIAANHCWAPCSGGAGLLYYRNDGDSLAHIDHELVGFPDGDNAFPAACDFDADGDLDIVYRRDENRNLVFRNHGDGTFSEDPAVAFSADSSIGFSWADFDNDGDFDLLTTSVANSRLYINNAGGFNRAAVQAYNPGSGPWFSAAWGDCDNDGDPDLVLASMTGMYGPRANAFLLNNGDGTFTKETVGPVATDLETSIGAGWADYDRDGDLDLLIVNNNYQHNALYQNDGNSNSWIAVNCVGTVSNRSAIGAEILVVATINGLRVCQLQQIASQSGACAQMPLEAHFGLGDATLVDSLRLEWPSGIVQVLEDVAVDQYLTVHETCCSGRVGDANGVGGDEPTIGDVSLIIDALFITASETPLTALPACMAEADVNLSSQNPPAHWPPVYDDITVGDISTLIDYLFITGSSLGLSECL